MIYEGFMFFNELDLLEIHLQELDPVVDRFIIVESHIKHDGGPKPLYYGDNSSRFIDFKNKIIHIVTDDIERLNENKLWCSRQERDDTNRNHIRQGLRNASPNDIFIHSDADEIIDAKVLKEIISSFQPDKIYCFQMRLLNYYFNLQSINRTWQGSTMTRVGNLSTVKALRQERLNDRNIMVPNGGWHFTYMGSPENILLKCNTMTDTESHRYTIDEVKECIKNHTDIGGLAQPWRGVHIMEWISTDKLPRYVQDNLGKFATYIGAQ